MPSFSEFLMNIFNMLRVTVDYIWRTSGDTWNSIAAFSNNPTCTKNPLKLASFLHLDDQSSRMSNVVRYFSVHRTSNYGDRNFCMHRASTIDPQGNMHRALTIEHRKLTVHRASTIGDNFST